MAYLEYQRNIDYRILLRLQKYAISVFDRIADRCNRPDIRIEGQPYRAISDDSVQRILRLYRVFVQLLRRNDNLSRNEYAYGIMGVDFVA